MKFYIIRFLDSLLLKRYKIMHSPNILNDYPQSDLLNKVQKYG